MLPIRTAATLAGFALAGSVSAQAVTTTQQASWGILQQIDSADATVQALQVPTQLGDSFTVQVELGG